METENGTLICNHLIDDDAYTTEYKRIKFTHGQQCRKEWAEKTDPDKHVFEDCGITAYLMELWRIYGIGPNNKFADIGCGNGLLVHLLAKENLTGFGVDVRKRKSWAQFQSQGTDLRQIAIDPSSIESTLDLLNGVDFLIGNHSDELTPWIPVIAARLQCNFFLLPCCQYNFFSKFMKHTPTPHMKPYVGGVAEQYYAYIEYICNRLGFKLMIDDIKIPSRKKKCFIGIVPENGLAQNIEEVITELLSRAKSHKDKFVPKPAKIEVRNCSKIPFEVQQVLAKRIVNYLIRQDPERKYNGWRFGGSAHLSSISKDILTTADRSILSRQDKGIQTFLRNHYQVFSVEKAVVSIRFWPTCNFTMKTGKTKHRTCWFYQHHPDGCPLLKENECSYMHC